MGSVRFIFLTESLSIIHSSGQHFENLSSLKQTWHYLEFHRTKLEAGEKQFDSITLLSSQLEHLEDRIATGALETGVW